MTPVPWRWTCLTSLRAVMLARPVARCTSATVVPRRERSFRAVSTWERVLALSQLLVVVLLLVAVAFMSSLLRRVM